MTFEFPDLSSNNGSSIDVAALYRSGVPDIMLKASEGTGYHWTYGDTLAQQMHAQGGHSHRYHWLRPDSDPVAQAQYFVSLVRGGLITGDRLMVDFETTSGAIDPGDSARASQLATFGGYVNGQLSNVELGCYTGNWYLYNKPACQAVVRAFGVYLSDYSGLTPDNGIDNPYGLDIICRQFTNQGSAAGVPGLCDMNRWIAGHEVHGDGTPIDGDDDMPLNADDKTWLANQINSSVKAQLNDYFANGEGNPDTGRVFQAVTKSVTKYFATGEGNPTTGRIVQACRTALKLGPSD